MRSTLRHFSSFDGEEKMALNQIKFNFSAGGLKPPKFKRKILIKKPNENSLWSYHKGRDVERFMTFSSFCKLLDPLQRQTLLN